MKRILYVLLSLICLFILLSCQGAIVPPKSSTRSQPTVEVPTPVPTPTPTKPSPAPIEPPQKVSRDRLREYLAALSKERYSDRQRQVTRSYIESVLSRNGWLIEEQAFPEGINIIAHQPNRLPNSHEILVGAHYDSVRGTPGADDNATGVAAALELSNIFKNYATPQNLTLAFFDLEEYGALGSMDYVTHTQNLANLNGAIILEMLGYTCHTPQCQKIPPELDVKPPSDIGDFLSVIGDTEHPFLINAFRAIPSPLALFTLDVPFKGLLSPILLRSDHAPFWLKGKGAVMVSDTAFLRNPNYHRASDTIDTIDLDFLSQSTELVAQATTSLLRQSPISEKSDKATTF